MGPTRPEVGLGVRHQKVQRLRRLLSRRSARQSEQAFVVEGAKLLHEALAAGVAVESVYVEAGTGHEAVERAREAGIRVHELVPGVMARVADTAHPQPVMAVLPVPAVALSDVAGADLFVVAVDVRDPGNAGTVLRSAEAAGVGAVVWCSGSVDVFNPKTVRASAGSMFHVPVVTGGDPVEVLSEMASWGVRRLATVAAGGRHHTATDLTGRLAFVLGNEAHGLPAGLSGSIDAEVSIPMAGRSESLNVGMAAAVLCFEAARQRSGDRAP